ncbi:hypothetical protein VOM14_27810 [Paraburkholderia sp. MPAMCS5]|uniref:hypothetical protein n=1 Tax=Paraburkholderia sp. MPAMCS5 TaxID=3112563 RepID=UPI002E19D2C5|nr:hypothetical protein [Paraburkholderia sp. MPAMCS5]
MLHFDFPACLMRSSDVKAKVSAVHVDKQDCSTDSYKHHQSSLAGAVGTNTARRRALCKSGQMLCYIFYSVPQQKLSPRLHKKENLSRDRHSNGGMPAGLRVRNHDVASAK